MPVGRDTGLPVVHYLSGRVTRNTPRIQLGVKLGDLPLGAILLSARSICAQGWGGGRDLIVSLGAPNPVDIATLSVNVPKVDDQPIDDLTEILPLGREVLVRLDSAPTATGTAVVILTYLPGLG